MIWQINSWMNEWMNLCNKEWAFYQTINDHKNDCNESWTEDEMEEKKRKNKWKGEVIDK